MRHCKPCRRSRMAFLPASRQGHINFGHFNFHLDAPFREACRTIATERNACGPSARLSKVKSSMSVDQELPAMAHEPKHGSRGDDADHPAGTIVTISGRSLQPNSGIPLDLHWVREMQANTSAIERRVQSQVARRSVKKEWQAAWLLRAITCMDLTTLSGDDTDDRVRRLCAKAQRPIQSDLVRKLGIEELDVKVAAVCVYHTFIETALRALEELGCALPPSPRAFRRVCRR